MKLFYTLFIFLLCFCTASADPPIPQSTAVVNLQFGPIVQQSDGSTPITGLLTGSTITATGGSTTTITTATIGYVGQYIVFGSATATTALRNVACYVTAVSGSGPYTLTVAPTLLASPTSSDTYNQSNIGVFISKDGSTWATPNGALTETGKGYYYIAANATDNNTIGPIKVHWDVYGSTAGISNETSPGFVIATNPYNATNGGLSALPTASPNASGGIVTVGTGSGQVNPSGGTFTNTTLSVSDTTAATIANLSQGSAGTQKFTATALSLAPTGGSAPTTSQIAAAILKTPANLLATDSNGYTTFNNTSIPTVTNAVPLPTNAPSTFLANDTTTAGIASGITSNGTAVTAVSAKLGTPAGASVSADIATANGSLSSLSATIGTINTNTTPTTYYIAGSHTTTGTAETLTQAQWNALIASELSGDHTATAISGNIQTVTYYLAGRTAVSGNETETAVVNTATGQVVSYSIVQPFPAGTGS